MKLLKKVAAISILAVVCFCLIAASLVLARQDLSRIETGVYGWWVSQSVPRPRTFDVPLSRRTVLQVYPNAQSNFWLGTEWTSDGSQVQVYDSRSKFYANNVMPIDPQAAVYGTDLQTAPDGNVFGLSAELPFNLADGESLWGACLDKGIFFTATRLEDGIWEPRLWKGGQLLKVFERNEFPFGPYQTGISNEPVAVKVEFSNFSPDCRYFTVDTNEQTWLLDTVALSFAPLEIRETLLPLEAVYSLLYATCHQCVRPAWAPNSREFAFTRHNGLQEYDVVSDKWSWLLAPNYDASALEWSRTGDWILGLAHGTYVVISSDGSSIGRLHDCRDIADPSWSSTDIVTWNEAASWSPRENKIALMCHQYDKSTCVDGRCERERSYLIIWDLSSLARE